MNIRIKEHKKLSCFNEYDELKKVVMCQPQYMNIRSMINETQKHFKNEGIHIERALEQHDQFVKSLRNFGIEVYLLPYHAKYPEQVFTRDIGFTLGETIFVADMAHDVRKGEENDINHCREAELSQKYCGEYRGNEKSRQLL